MPDIILHHYPLSTFSEKARLALGLKGLAYDEVIVPVILPKPELIPLTGGYRRAPVMQIGADIYCDTQLILRKLEELHPAPTLFPNHCEGEATALAWWAERFIFMPTLGFIANVSDGLYDADFVAERKAFGFLIGKEEVRPLLGRYVQQLVAHLGWLVNMLSDGRHYVLGDQVSAADLAVFPAIWFARKYGGSETERLFPIDALRDWFERISAIGYGKPTEISGAKALDVARDAKPNVAGLPVRGDPSGIRRGAWVTVSADDTGRDPATGELVGADDQEVVIKRHDARLGDIHVHFPRAGYDVTPASND